jgi:hypothetical protein
VLATRPAIAQFRGRGNWLISKVRLSSLDHARHAVDLVTAPVDTPGLVEHAVFGEDLVNGRAPARGVVFTEDVVKIADEQGRYAVGHKGQLVLLISALSFLAVATRWPRTLAARSSFAGWSSPPQGARFKLGAPWTLNGVRFRSNARPRKRSQAAHPPICFSMMLSAGVAVESLNLAVPHVEEIRARNVDLCSCWLDHAGGRFHRAAKRSMRGSELQSAAGRSIIAL